MSDKIVTNCHFHNGRYVSMNYDKGSFGELRLYAVVFYWHIIDVCVHIISVYIEI